MNAGAGLVSRTTDVRLSVRLLWVETGDRRLIQSVERMSGSARVRILGVGMQVPERQ